MRLIKYYDIFDGVRTSTPLLRLRITLKSMNKFLTSFISAAGIYTSTPTRSAHTNSAGFEPRIDTASHTADKFDKFRASSTTKTCNYFVNFA